MPTLVSGAPGTGKTTVASFGVALRFPLLCKDRLKETLQDALAQGGATGSPIARAAMYDIAR